MRIRECGCDDKIVLSKFKFNCDEVDKSIPDPLPQNLNHFLLIAGKPGSRCGAAAKLRHPTGYYLTRFRGCSSRSGPGRLGGGRAGGRQAASGPAAGG